MKNKYIAAFLALCFGWLGFHKFYLGKWIQGILYIVFMATFIPFTISLFESLVYAMNSDELFDIKYNAEYIKNKDFISNRKK